MEWEIFYCNYFFVIIKRFRWLLFISMIFCQSIVTDITRDTDGNISNIEYFNTSFKKVQLIKMETYYPNGQISSLEMFANGVKNGQHQEFYDNGKLKMDGHFKDGDEIGLWTEYYSTGEVMRMYYADKYGLNGSLNEWYENGEKKVSGVYNEGQKHGVWISWFANGLKKSMVTYKNGVMEGVFMFYYENGTKKSEGTVNYKGQKEERCWDSDGVVQNCKGKE